MKNEQSAQGNECEELDKQLEELERQLARLEAELEANVAEQRRLFHLMTKHPSGSAARNRLQAEQDLVIQEGIGISNRIGDTKDDIREVRLGRQTLGCDGPSLPAKTLHRQTSRKLRPSRPRGRYRARPPISKISSP